MEARFGGETHNLFGIGAANMWVAGKRSLEWDLNDWRWDGDLFIARPLNPVPSSSVSRQFFPVGDVTPEAGNSSNSSSSCSDEVNLGFEKGKGIVDKKRRIGVTEDGDLNGEEMGSLSLKLGGQGYVSGEREAGNWNENSGKKTKVVGGSSSRAVCQVEDCGADLSKAKDYHRRHKVCELHSKASKALVGNAMQRFCQQCSRFHVLQEFDEGKRSCRRRLAGHNKRRRKTNPEAAGNGSPQNNDKNSSYILISLLRILSNMHSNKSDQPTDQDLLSHLLKSLGGPTADHGERNISGLSQEPRDLLKGGTSFGNSEQVVHVQEAKGSNMQNSSSRKPIVPIDYNPYPEVRDNITGQVKVNNFDLNDVYVDSDDSTDDVERLPIAVNGNGSLDCPSSIRQDSLQSSPPQTSGNSDSASAQSPSSSSGDAQSRTDRIIFKLFGKDPNDFPRVLRAQILDWLSHSPMDIESYIRPGCVILTIYLRQAEAEWEDLCSELSSSLMRLFDVCDDTFWRTGWVYIRVQHQVAFVYNGRVIVDSALPLRSNNYSKIISVKPIALSASEETQFVVKGTNLSRPSARLLCGIEGSYIAQENTLELIDGVDSYSDHHEVQCVNFSCTVPALMGRGFIEIEDNGVSSSFFPFIVAEEDVCSEIRKLEGVFDIDEAYAESDETGKMEARALALEFLHEMGWILHRSQLKSRLGQLDPNANLFSLRRFEWLMEFSMNHEWCAVVEKLLNIMLSGLVDIGDHSSLSQALSEMGLLHRAVRRNSRFLVDFLLNYDHKKLETENKALGHGGQCRFLFRPDVSGPAGLTPLHIAAGKDGSEDVLDALTSDPGMIGIEAWKNARDSTGFTPGDYARLRGHYSYIRLVQKKINPRPAVGHHVLDIPDALLDSGVKEKQTKGLATGFEIGSFGSRCKLCSQKLACGVGRKSLLYRPAMVSMVAIAAVCVCAALLFKSCPEVVYVFRPFRWESLEYGAS